MGKIKNIFEKTSPVLILICTIILALISFVDLSILITAIIFFVLYKTNSKIYLPIQNKNAILWIVVGITSLVIIPCLLDIVAGIAELFGDGVDELNQFLENIRVYGSYSSYAHINTAVSRGLIMVTAFSKSVPWFGMLYVLIIALLNNTKRHSADKIFIKLRYVVLTFSVSILHLLTPLGLVDKKMAYTYFPEGIRMEHSLPSNSSYALLEADTMFFPSVWKTFNNGGDIFSFIIQFVGVIGLFLIVLKVSMELNKLWKDNVRLCPYCCNEINGNKKFCTKCGNKI